MVQKQENGNAMNEEPLSSLISTRDMSDQDESDEVPSDDDSSFEQSIESDSQHQRYANDFYRQYWNQPVFAIQCEYTNLGIEQNQ